MRKRREPPAGVVLLEVLVALAILGASGAALAALAVGTSDAVRRAQHRDDEMRRASAFLDAVALWPREDLDRHLGAHAQGAWTLDVRHSAPTLYQVALEDSAGGVPLLVTALYRPVPRPAELPSRAP